MKGKRRWVLLMLVMAGLLVLTMSQATWGSIPDQFRHVSPAFAAGGIGDEFGITTRGNERDPKVAYDSTNDRALVVWRSYNGPGNNDVRAQIVNANGTLYGGEIVIADSSDNEVYPDVAYSPDEAEWLIVYVHWVTTSNKQGKKRPKITHVVRGQRVGWDGVVRGLPFDISPVYSESVTHSRVAYNTATGKYLGVWQVYDKEGKGRKGPRGSIRGATVDTASGTPDVGAIQTYAAYGYSTGCGDVDLAADNDTTGGRFLVIFPYCVAEGEVYGRLAAGDGTPDVGPFEIASISGAHLDAQSVAYGGGQYLVVFVSPKPGGGHQFKARRVSNTGEPQESNAGFVVFDPPVEDGVTDGGMAVEYGSASFLATWSYDPIIVDEIVPDFGYDRHIYGREVLPNETMPNAEFAISECNDPPEGAGCNQQAPGLAFNTTQGHFIVVWSNVPERYPGNIPANIWGRRWTLGP